MSNRRTGKIARLQYELRNGVNQMLRDGKPYASIIAFLDKSGVRGVNEQNLTNWREGGHQDWLKEQERLEDMRIKREFAFEVVKQNEGSKIHEATMQLAASQLYEVLNDFDVAALKDLVGEKPENYAKVVNSIAKLSKEALGYERFKAEVKRHLAEVKDAAAKGGLTPETIERIERELKLL